MFDTDRRKLVPIDFESACRTTDPRGLRYDIALLDEDVRTAANALP